MDTAQGGDLVNQLDPTGVLPSDRVERTVRIVPSNHPGRTARVVHCIEPRTSGMEFRLEPRPDDRTERTRVCLSPPS